MIQFLKKNRQGITLSFICGMNWLIGRINYWQLLVVGAFSSGICMQSGIQDLNKQLFTQIYLYVSCILFLISFCVFLVTLASSGLSQIKRAYSTMMKFFIIPFVFLIGFASDPKNYETNKIIYLVATSVICYLLCRYVQPKLYLSYLYKHVLNKDYLCESLNPTHKIWDDVIETDFNKRLNFINQHAIKIQYQDFVDLSALRKEEKLEVECRSEEIDSFIDHFIEYSITFRVYIFGKCEKKHRFSHSLITFNTNNLDRM